MFVRVRRIQIERSNFMKTELIVRGMCLLAALLSIPSQIEAIDQLWERSVQVVKASELMIPGELIIEQSVVDGRGKTESESETIIHVGHEGSRLYVELVQFSENGKDKTVDSRQTIEDEMNKEVGCFKCEMPYHLDNPSQVILRREAKSKFVDEVECVGYVFEVWEKDFEHGDSPFCYEGIVWLDPNTAVPVQIESFLKDPPKEEDGAEVLNLSQTVNFEYSEGAWKRVSEEQELWLNVQVLFKKVVAVIRTDSRYLNHWSLRCAVGT